MRALGLGDTDVVTLSAPNEQLVQRLRSALAAGPPLRLALLFGSAATGRLHALSDVDVAILPADPAASLSDELALQARLEQACGRKVDLVRLDDASTLLRWQVARDGHVLLAEPASEAVRYRARAASDYGDFLPALVRASRVFAQRLAQRAKPTAALAHEAPQ